MPLNLVQAVVTIIPNTMTHHEAGSVIPSLEQRPLKNTIILFDVDQTLTLARRVREMTAHY